MARVQEDPEERIAESAGDDLVERAGREADVKRLVPLRDRGEVRSDQPVDVIARSGPAARAASSTTNPARQFRAPQIPNAA